MVTLDGDGATCDLETPLRASSGDHTWSVVQGLGSQTESREGESWMSPLHKDMKTEQKNHLEILCHVKYWQPEAKWKSPPDVFWLRTLRQFFCISFGIKDVLQRHNYRLRDLNYRAMPGDIKLWWRSSCEVIGMKCRLPRGTWAEVMADLNRVFNYH